MANHKIKLFLASSAELKEDRQAFEIAINRKNKEWHDKGIFLELVIWEDFLDALSQTRLQDEYNKAIRDSDIFVMLFFSKVGKYTEEEFETAFKQFKSTSKPYIFTYFKDAPVNLGSAGDDVLSLLNFKKKLGTLGHFYTTYANTHELLHKFDQQLDKLAANGFIEFNRDIEQSPPQPRGDSYQATLNGSGAIAQGPNAQAVGAHGVLIGGNSSGSINTGTQINTGGGAYVKGNVRVGGDFIGRDQINQGLSAEALAGLFAPLLASVAQQAPADAQAEARRVVSEIQAEAGKGKHCDDTRMGKLLEGLVALVPKAVESVVGVFANPILSGIAGPVTKYVLEKLKGG